MKDKTEHVGGNFYTLWRDAYVAALQGLAANPELTNMSSDFIAVRAAMRADAAVDEFEKRYNTRA